MVVPSAEVFLPLDELVDKTKELERLNAEKKKLEGESIMISEWPEYDEKLNFPKDVESIELIMQSISAIRNRRAEMNVPPSKKAKVIIVTDKTDVFEQGTVFFEKLASASEAVVQTDFKRFRGTGDVCSRR